MESRAVAHEAVVAWAEVVKAVFMEKNGGREQPRSCV